jgi:hypothetical protein
VDGRDRQDGSVRDCQNGTGSRWHRVRDVDEVMRDRHMHERATFEWIEDDEIGRNRRADDAIDEGLKAAVSKT